MLKMGRCHWVGKCFCFVTFQIYENKDHGNKGRLNQDLNKSDLQGLPKPER